MEPAWLDFSALDGSGVRVLIDQLRETMPEGLPLFPEDVLTDYPRKLNMADVIREKLFNGCIRSCRMRWRFGWNR